MAVGAVANMECGTWPSLRSTWFAIAVVAPPVPKGDFFFSFLQFGLFARASLQTMETLSCEEKEELSWYTVVLTNAGSTLNMT